jgi:hypothetical protein
LAEKNRDKLVHPSIGEEQVGGVWQQARRGYDGVLFPSKKIEKALADLGARHHGVVKKMGMLGKGCQGINGMQQELRSHTHGREGVLKRDSTDL